MMILWFLIIGVLVYLLVGGNIDLNSFQRKNGVNYLDERLAKGEISIEEYNKIIDTLKENK